MNRKTQFYDKKSYRRLVTDNFLECFEVIIEESDLFIRAESKLYNTAFESLAECRNIINNYIKICPLFKTSLEPLRPDKFAHSLISQMLSASKKAAVGPMASVAGAVSLYVGKRLLEYTDQVIVENGGDIFLDVKKDIKIPIFAGNSPLSLKVSILIEHAKTPIGVCTSSGTVGHSLSLGTADAVCVISSSPVLADAAATSICNMVLSAQSISDALDFGAQIEGISGILIILNDKLGVWGDVNLSH